MEIAMAKAYWIAFYRSISNPDALAAYAKLAGPAIAAAGGRFLARGNAAKAYEAGGAQRVVVIEFDSGEKALAAHDNQGYQAAPEGFRKAADRVLRMGEGLGKAVTGGEAAMALTATRICNFGWKARDFKLKGVDGKFYTLDDVRGPKGTLVVFICNHCPYVRAVIGRLVEEASALKTIGIGTIAIMPNDTQSHPEDSFENMKRFAQAHGFTFPYVIDETQEVARAYDAQCTPDFFGFNADDELQYRGRLDAARMSITPRARRELFEAMTQVAETG